MALNSVAGPQVPQDALRSVSMPTGPVGLMTCLYLSELHWWTTDEAILDQLKMLGLPVAKNRIFWSEHKVNGKSKGLACVEFLNSVHAKVAKDWFDSHEFQNKHITAELSSTSHGQNPFKTTLKNNADPPAVPRTSTYTSNGDETSAYLADPTTSVSASQQRTTSVGQSYFVPPHMSPQQHWQSNTWQQIPHPDTVPVSAGNAAQNGAAMAVPPPMNGWGVHFGGYYAQAA